MRRFIAAREDAVPTTLIDQIQRDEASAPRPDGAARLALWLGQYWRLGIAFATAASLLMFATAVWSVVTQRERRAAVAPNARAEFVPLETRTEPRLPDAVAAVPAAAAPAPPATRTETLTRGFDSPCVLPPSYQACDFVDQGLWDGVLGAWQSVAVEKGEPPPNQDEAFRATIQRKFEAGDPNTRIAVARAHGAAALFLATVRFIESATEAGAWDVHAELVNWGAAPAPLGGLQLRGPSGAPLVALATDASELPADARCWLSSGPPAPASCATRATRTGPLRGDAPARITVQDREGRQIDALVPGVTAR